MTASPACRSAPTWTTPTLKVPSYVLFGIETSYEFERGVTVFVDARNLADMRYVSNFSTVTDARTANTSVFYPGR